MRLHLLVVTLAALSLGASAHAQSINIDFGAPGEGPSSSYAAAGRAGVWNVIGVMPFSQRFDLVGLTGQPVAAKIYNIGGTAMLTHDNPATAGDDARLLDDMFLSFNNPLDLCLFFEHLINGDYEVILYGLTPDNAAHQNRMRVDFATPGPVWVGGAWNGAHAEGVTFSRHLVTITDGRINPHAGEISANYQSGVNGVQLLYLGPCPGDANGDHVIDFADFAAVLSNYGVSGPGVPGDVNGDEVVDFTDFSIVLSNYGSAC